MNQEHQQVLNAVATMTKAFQSKDIEGVMAAYAAQATVVFEPGKPIGDMATIRAMFEGTFPMNPRFTYGGHEVFVAGDLALHIAPWTMKGTGPDGQAIEQTGLSVAVLQRDKEGEWRLVIDNPHGQMLLQ